MLHVKIQILYSVVFVVLFSNELKYHMLIHIFKDLQTRQNFHADTVLQMDKRSWLFRWLGINSEYV